MKGNNILITGGAGFIGSNYILYLLNNYKDIHIVNLDPAAETFKYEPTIDIREGVKRYVAWLRQAYNVPAPQGVSA